MTRSALFIVLAHALVVFAHGYAHAQAGVGMSPLGNLFILVVIVLAPFAALVAARFHAAAGAVLLFSSMAASLLFGLVNHFLLRGGDHVSHVQGPFSALFGWTAALLLLTEGVGTIAGGVFVTRAFASMQGKEA